MGSIPIVTTPQRALKLRTELKKLQFSSPARAFQGREQFPHAQQHVTVNCFKDGGAAGGGGTTCSWTFTIKDYRTGDTLATGLDRESGWHPNIEYETPNALGVKGDAYRDIDGSWKLWDVRCNFNTEECP